MRILSQFAILLMLYPLTSCVQRPPPIQNLFPRSLSKEEVLKQWDENSACSSKRTSIGIGTVRNEQGEIKVSYVLKDYPADLAQIKVGDILLEIDGRAIKNRFEVYQIFRSKNPGDQVKLTIRRDGVIEEFALKTSSQYSFKDSLEITEILLNEKPVHLAILIGEISNSINMPPQTIEVWKGSMRSELLGLYESVYISAYEKDNNFSIIDRNKIESVLKETEFQQSGLIPETRIKLGNMLGATHLLIIDFLRTYRPLVDTTIRRLIEVESGKTLAVSTCPLRR
jgi:hypothetical protein